MKNLKMLLKPIFLSLAIFIMMTVVPNTAFAATGDFTYQAVPDDAESIEVIGYTGNDANLTIPMVIDGKTVLGIGDNAFQGSDTLKSFVVPESVTYIGMNAFSNCSNLDSIRFLGNAPIVGENAFLNSSSNLKIYYNPKNSGFTNPWNQIPSVPFISLTGIQIDKTSVDLSVGDTFKPTVTFVPSNATNKNISWTSSVPKVASVDNNGTIKALSVGTSTITATTEDGSLIVSVSINVIGLPTLPTGEYGNAQSYTAINLFWNAVQNATDYQIYRSNTSNGSYALIATVKTTGFTNSGLKKGTTYYYKIRSFNSKTGKYSNYSPVITARTLDDTIGSKLVTYMSILNNRDSVFKKAVALHNGVKSNTCAYTASEALRRIGLNIPNGTGRTEQVEMHLKARGWTREMNLNLLQPGDVCFTTDSKGNKLGGHSTHTFIFMGWANKEKTLMNICDNQVPTYGAVYHTRTIKKSEITDATAFFYHTNQTDVSKILKLSTKLGVKSVAYNKIQINWEKATSAYGYQIYRATSRYGTYSNIGTSRSTSFVDSKAVNGKTYYYKVRAYSTATPSEKNVKAITIYGNYSSVYSVKASLPAPKVSFSSTVKGAVTLSWNGVGGATNYEVYRAKSPKGAYSKLATTSKTKYTNTKLTSKKTYYYKVRAYRLVGKTKVYSGYFYINGKVK